MPFCKLNESQALEKFKLTFLQNNKLKGAKGLKYFYKQLGGMDVSNISHICHKIAKFSKIDFKVRLIATKKYPSVGDTYQTVLEELVDFEVYACNDKAFAKVNEDRYFFCPNVGNNKIEDEDAFALGEEVAKKLYTDVLAKRGYDLENCVVEDWDYVGKGTETYTEYTFVYDYMGEQHYVKAVGSDDVLVVINEPKRTKKKKFNPLFVIIPVLAIAAIAVGIIMLT